MATSPKSAGPATGGANETTQDLAADLARLREDVAKLAAQLQAVGEQGMKTAKRAASEKVDQLRSQGESAMNELRGSAEDLEEQLVARVRQKPLSSLAMAAGVGYLMALMMRR